MADLAKLVEELSGLTALELAQLKKMLEEKWGVTAAAAPVMVAAGAPAAGGAAPAPQEEEKTEFDVILEDVGPKKIDVIKVIRSITNLGLKEARTLSKRPSRWSKAASRRRPLWTPRRSSRKWAQKCSSSEGRERAATLCRPHPWGAVGFCVLSSPIYNRYPQ